MHNWPCDTSKTITHVLQVLHNWPCDTPKTITHVLQLSHNWPCDRQKKHHKWITCVAHLVHYFVKTLPPVRILPTPWAFRIVHFFNLVYTIYFYYLCVVVL